ncbi:hypothetical protein V1264_003271 [Littorina saxatilis]
MLLQYGEDSDEESSFNEQDGSGTTAPDSKSPREKKRQNSTRQSQSLSPSRRISEDSVGKQVGALISDDEGDHHFPERKRPHGADSLREEVVPPKMTMIDVSKKIAPAVSPMSNDSRSSFADSVSSKGPNHKKASRLTMRLVSYLGDDQEEESDSESSGSEEGNTEDQNYPGSVLNKGASPGTRGLIGMDGGDIQLPPEPTGKCTKDVQDKITDLYMKMREQGFDPNSTIQRLTSFRNPSIYEKLVQLHHIDEKGSNFPLDVYNPNMWTKESFYDELDKAQKKDMERREREKDRKAKIEFISGTKKSGPSSESSDDKKRKSKWDALPAGLPQPHRSSSGSGPNLTSSATGTRATVISAVGTLTKKASFSIINTSGPAK